MRGAPALAMALLLFFPAAGGEEEPRSSLADAVAPAQLVVDATGRIVDLAISEIAHDLTPDAALAVREDLRAFAKALSAEWTLPARSSHPEEALAAIPYAVSVASAIDPFPDDARILAQAQIRCARNVLEFTTYVDAVAAYASLDETTEAIAALSTMSTPGVDPSPLGSAAVALRGLVEKYAGLVDCKYLDEGTRRLVDPASGRFLDLTLQPSTVHPLQRMRISGVTSALGPVRILAAPLDLDRGAFVREGRFSVETTVPENASFGEWEVRAEAANLSASAPLVITYAPSSLELAGPGEIREGALLAIRVRLSSPVPHLTDSATVRVEGDQRSNLTLVGGEGRFETKVGPGLGRIRLDFMFDGVRFVGGASKTFEVVVLPMLDGARATPASPGDPEEEPSIADKVRELLSDLPSWILAALLLALVLLVVAGLALRRVRRSGADVAALAPGSARGTADDARPRDEAPPNAATEEASAFPGLVAAFALVARLLRARGEARASMTAREIAPIMARGGFDPQGVVPAFERARYGGEAEEPTWIDRARSWFREALARIRGAAT